jgi:hypothetical protein
MAHLIAAGVITFLVFTSIIFSWGWLAHERLGRSIHADRQMALALPAIERPRAPEPVTPLVGAPPAVVHVHLHQDPGSPWGRSGDTWTRPAWRGEVLDAQIMELPAAQ